MAARIAVDAMGGDHAPGAIVEGSLLAAREWDHHIILVGRKAEVEAEISRLGAPAGIVEIVDAPEVIGMNEPPVLALRRKKRSSIRVAAHLVREGEADGLVSAGNTGAVMACSKVSIGTLPGIDRPAVTAVVPNLRGRSVWLDVGANVDSKPLHILQFALMGSLYARTILDIPSPRVGLLSIGEEDMKGNLLTREVFKELQEGKLNFIGNVEGRDIFNGNCDVIVCDGFTGNVSLKAIESAAEMLGLYLKQELTSTLRARLGLLLAAPAMRRFKRVIDYAEYGGFPLLGVRSAVIIGHGRSSPKAVKNAIRACADYVQHRVSARIQETLDREAAEPVTA
ncbi:MAG TPA: phosphate acyltransferase PlsX [Candidatus Saccharimonadales bacterium]|nr:phosphate acyltransferase PlsX [Candidatus Saccharimonadales bacterium]